ncbi:fibrinogen-like protein A [Scaptodrosophila lebanonensis]|uniref:Fibrinogen-like protein A n=1 Tax=Drosophila lebanonensis TaxID=7225 RepID=A0A6J2TXM0_DROLE|nr:fibrinogen-like protein A [Scaptodrosophila lebanonensis]
MALETLVTALACLSSTTPPMRPNADMTVSAIMKNSHEPFRLDNSTGCPVSALGGFTARIEYMSNELQSLKTQLDDIQQLIDEYKNNAVAAPTMTLESRILRADSIGTIPAAINVPFDDKPQNCWDQKHGEVLIRIAPDVEPFFVNCDQEERDGGWIVIAYRFDGSEVFNRGWQDYKSGFGSLSSEFFIGMDKLHKLTNRAECELYIVMRNQEKEQRFALYDKFSIGSESEKYLLYVLDSYRGDAGDSLRYHAGKKFTTFDQDNDDNAQNCARTHASAWWYGRDCFESNLFGTFQPKYAHQIGNYKGILWKPFLPGPTGSLSYVRMMIRPKKS